MNMLKTMLLMFILTSILLVAGQMLGGPTGVVIALVFAIGMNFFSYWFSDKIVLRMYRGQEVSRNEAPELHEIVEKLARRAEIPMPKVYILPSNSPNAFATGRNPNHAAVAVTQGLMRTLNRDELEGVLAHELGHVLHRDILIGTIAGTMAGAISMLASMAQWAMIFGGGDDEDNPFGFIGLLVGMIVLPIAAMLVQMAVSRSREFAADERAGELTGKPKALADALRKITATAQAIPMQEAGQATAHMFIANPLSGQNMAQLFSTHPDPEERIRRLMEQQEKVGYGAY